MDYITLHGETKQDLTKIFKVKKIVGPSSAKYSKVTEWTKTGKSITIPKAPKITTTHEIMRKPKSPGPATYKNFIDPEIAYKIKTKEPQMEMFAQVAWLS